MKNLSSGGLTIEIWKGIYLNNKMRYKVINKITGKDITSQEFWIITPYGDLCYLYYDNVIEHPDAVAIFEDIEIEKHCYQL